MWVADLCKLMKSKSLMQEYLKHLQASRHTMLKAEEGTREKARPGAAQHPPGPVRDLAQIWARFTLTSEPGDLRVLGVEENPNIQSDLELPEKESNTLCTYLKLRAVTLFLNLHRKIFC